MYACSWAAHLAPWSPTADALGGTHEGMFAQALARGRDEARSGTGCRLLAFTHDGALVGGFNLNTIVRGVFQNANAGWWVSADQLRKGYATEGVRALLALAFAPLANARATIRNAGADPMVDGITSGLGLHRVQCGVIPRNTASLAVAAKAGFRAEGMALQYLKIAGRWEDHQMFARTIEDGPLPPLRPADRPTDRLAVRPPQHKEQPCRD